MSSPAGEPVVGTTRPEHGDEVIGDGGSAVRTVARRFKRVRAWLVLAVLLAITLIFAGLTAGADNGPLAPDNAAPEGARAAAEVLKGSGVRIDLPDTFDEAVTALQGSDDTLLLHDPNGWLSPEQLNALGDGLADRVVLIEPNLAALSALADGIRSAGVVPLEAQEVLTAGCADSDAEAAQEISAGGFVFRGPVVCFPVSNESRDLQGSYVTTGDGRVLVLGNGAIASNELIAEHGNAALVLRALGSTSRLVWYQPTAEDLVTTSAPADPLSLLPAFINPLMLWLLLIASLAVLWRGRRLGPLVEEPLPVLVRSAETAAGRARLYQDARAVDHAADTLRAGTLTRVASALRVPSGSTRATVVAAAARETHRDYDELDELLNTYTPRSEAELVRWSQKLMDLEQEIRRA